MTARPTGPGATAVREEDGQVALVVLVYAVIALSLVLVAGAATQVHLARVHLVALADASSLAAAQALDEEGYYATGTTPDRGVPLTDASVRTAAQEALAAAPPPADLRGVVLGGGTGTPDGATAQVVLEASTTASLLPPWLGGAVELPVSVVSRARDGLVAP